MTLELEFHGGAGTVTGSKTLLRHRGRAVLVDCGLFQGLKRLRERNWKPLPFNAPELAAVVLTHAHLDHSGALPLLVRSGFRGPIYCTAATQALLAILLRDSARLQEEEAQYANRHGYSKHTPALPLYTEADADRALQQVQPVPWSIAITLGPSLTATLSPAGHLLGAASASIDSPEGRVLFSGDLGRVDADGYLYVMGRTDDLIITGGANVYPDEVEVVIRRLPGVADCVVVPRSHGDLGQSVHAVVAMQSGRPPLTLDELRRQLAGELSAYKMPRSLELVPEIARTDAGKVRRKSYR